MSKPTDLTIPTTALVSLLVTLGAMPLSAQSVLLRLDPPQGAVSKYVMHMETRMDSPMGQDQTMMLSDMYTTFTVVGVDGDVREYTTTTDSAHFESPAMPMIAQNMPDMTGETYTMRMTSRGEMMAMEFDQADLPPEAQEIASQMATRGFGMQLPEQAVSPGDTWNALQELDIPGAMGQSMSMRIEMTYTLDRVDGDVAFVSLTGPITMSGTGMPMTASGQMTGAMQLDMAHGRLAHSEMRMNIDMEAQGMAMQMRQIITMNLIGGM